MKMSNVLTKRNTTLDFIKFIASFFVVFIHIRFYGTLGVVMDAIARFAVPLFFISSGYFSYGNSTTQIKKKISSIFKLLLFALFIYLSKNLISSVYNNSFLYFDFSVFNLKAIIELVLFNVPIICNVHLWFLYALIYTYVLQYFVVKFHIKQRLCFIITAILLLLQILLGEGLSLLGMVLPIPLLRNFLLMGFPFFTIGIAIKRYEKKIINIKDYALILLIIIGIIESAFSIIFIEKNELYVGSLLVVFSVFALAIKYPHFKCCKFDQKVFATSTYIYIFHPLIISIIGFILNRMYLPVNNIVMTNIKPIFVCFLSFFVSLAYVVLLEFKKTKTRKD